MAGSLDSTTSIPLSKYNIALLTAASLIFVLFGLWLVLSTGARIESTLLRRLLGSLTLLIFVPAGLFAAYRLLDKKPGLVLDTDGMHNRGGSRVPWRDVARIDVTKTRNQPFLTFYVLDPKKYISAENPIQRKQNATNLRLYGSPVRISAEPLTISFEELHALVTRYHERYRT